MNILSIPHAPGSMKRRHRQEQAMITTGGIEMLREIKLRKILREGKVAIGTGIYSNSPTIVEVAGFSGLDFVRIDSVHGWRRDESMENMMRAATIAGTTPIIRIDKGDPLLVRKALEIGAEGLVIPNIETKEEVAQLVKSAKFPPRGVRGKGSQCFSARWGSVSDEEWIDWSDN
jgi:4-hydroxy-2-oxoheptanedioate aldolase